MDRELTPFDAVWPLVAERVRPLPIATTALADAVGRVLRRPGLAAWDLPRTDNSAMDGVAVRASDAVTAPATLRVGPGDAYAGSRDDASVEPGMAVPIGTGGVLPRGADAVVPKEHLRWMGGSVAVLEPARRGDHIRRRGEELRRGDVVVAVGSLLDPLHLAALAAAGVTEVEVSRRPVVRIVTSGDEVVAIGDAPSHGQVVDSNTPFLRGMLARLLGSTPETPPVARDDRETLRATLAAAVDGADLVVATGGVSVGDRDLVKPVLEEDLGFERLVWRIAQKPGKPTWIGLRDTTWALGLPGNPAAVAAMWYVLVRPLVLALLGASRPRPDLFPCRLASPLVPDRARLSLRWCVEGVDEGGRPTARPLARSASHMLSDFARADLLVLAPAGDAELAAGTRLQGLRLDR